MIENADTFTNDDTIGQKLHNLPILTLFAIADIIYQ